MASRGGGGPGGDPELGLVDGGEEDEAAAGLLQHQRVGVGQRRLQNGVHALHVLADGLWRESHEAAEDEQQQQPHFL